MLAQECIITPQGIQVVTITHPMQAEAIARCRDSGLDPFEVVNINEDASCDIFICGLRWQLVARELWRGTPDTERR